MEVQCPCYSGKSYSACCQPYHKGKAPPTAGALMRSRYAAYAMGKVNYIMRTTHPNGRRGKTDKEAWRQSLKQFCQITGFMGLQIFAEETLSEYRATVTFRAILIQDGRDASFAECSLFEKKNGRWMYLEQIN